MTQPLSPFCVYTIRHRQALDRVYRSGGRDQFEENKVWVTGKRLFLEAAENGQRMPIVFASADDTDRLIYYGILSKVQINEANSTTTYGFTDLQQISEHLPLSSLRLRSTNRPLSHSYIRPYAICFTPDFIR